MFVKVKEKFVMLFFGKDWILGFLKYVWLLNVSFRLFVNMCRFVSKMVYICIFVGILILEKLRC